MGQKRYTLSRGDTEKKDVVIADDATSFTGDVRIIVKDTAKKSEILKLIDSIKAVLIQSNYPF